MKRKREHTAGPLDPVTHQRAVFPIDPVSEAGQYLLNVQAQAASLPPISFIARGSDPQVVEKESSPPLPLTSVDRAWEDAWLAKLKPIEAGRNSVERTKAEWRAYISSHAPSPEAMSEFDLDTRMRVLWFFRSWVRSDMPMNERKWLVLLMPLVGGDIGILRIVGRKCQEVAQELVIVDSGGLGNDAAGAKGKPTLDHSALGSTKADADSEIDNAKVATEDETALDASMQAHHKDSSLFDSDVTVLESCNLVCSILVHFHRQLDFTHQYKI